MKINYITEKDIKRKRKEIISNIENYDKSPYLRYNGYDLYMITSGHSFLKGFFIEYITKEDIKIIQYGDEFEIEGVDGVFVYNDDNFIKKSEKVTVPSSTETETIVDLTFPIVNNIQCKTIGQDLVPVPPMTKEQLLEMSRKSKLDKLKDL
jgi:hypothetical protein